MVPLTVIVTPPSWLVAVNSSLVRLEFVTPPTLPKPLHMPPPPRLRGAVTRPPPGVACAVTRAQGVDLEPEGVDQAARLLLLRLGQLQALERLLLALAEDDGIDGLIGLDVGQLLLELPGVTGD